MQESKFVIFAQSGVLKKSYCNWVSKERQERRVKRVLTTRHTRTTISGEYPQVKFTVNWYCFNRDKFGEKEVTVAVTPNGYADAVCNQYFVMPEERTMSFSSFLDIMEGDRKSEDDQHGVFYIQKQNSNLTTEFTELIPDVEADIPWATEAFGKCYICRKGSRILKGRDPILRTKQNKKQKKTMAAKQCRVGACGGFFKKGVKRNANKSVFSV